MRKTLQTQGLPHSEESERAVLSAVMLQPDLAPQLLDELQQEAFFLERHQLIYRTYATLAKAEKEINLRTIQDGLEESGSFETVGGFAYLAGMDLDLPNLDHFSRFCAIVRERYAKRRLILWGEAIRAAAMNGSPAAQLISDAELELADIERNQLEAAPVERIGDLMLDLDFQRNDPGLVGVTSGIADLDKVTGGWRGGQLITLAGATSMGKTAAGLGFAVAAARSGASTLVVSLEMTEDEIKARFLSMTSQIPHANIDLGRVPNARMPDALEAVRMAQDLPLWITDKTPQTPQSIAATARRHQLKHGLDLLVVDYLSLVQYAGSQRDIRIQHGEMAWAFKMLAKGLGIPVIEIHQLRRIEGRRPKLTDLKESGEIENHSNVCVFVYRENYYDDTKPKGEAEFLVLKNRGGRTGKVPAAWVGETMTFRDLARDEPQGPPRGW